MQTPFYTMARKEVVGKLEHRCACSRLFDESWLTVKVWYPNACRLSTLADDNRASYGYLRNFVCAKSVSAIITGVL